MVSLLFLLKDLHLSFKKVTATSVVQGQILPLYFVASLREISLLVVPQTKDLKMVNSEDFLESSLTIQESVLDNLLISSLDTREGSLNSYTGSGVTETFIQHLPEEVLHKVNLINSTNGALN